MLLIKEFLRKKSTKICLLLLSLLMTTILIILNFNMYYTNFINNTYKEKTYFLITSDNDFYADLKKNSNIDNIKEVLVFNINSLDFFYNITWNHLISHENKLIVEKNNKLKEEEIIIAITKERIDLFDDINMYNNKKISFLNENQSLNFTLKKIEISNYPKLIINDNLYQKLLGNRKEYNYVVDLKNYEDLDINIENAKITFVSEYLDIDTVVT